MPVGQALRVVVVADPHVAARGMFMPAVDPVVGEMLQTRMPVGLGAPPRPAPVLGEHGREVLGELGFDTQDIAALVEGGVLIVPGER